MRHTTPLALCSAAALSLLSGVRCADDATARTRVSFAASVRGLAPAAETSAGWTLRLEQAFVTVGPVRWFEGEPLLSRRLLRALSAGTAFAHPHAEGADEFGIGSLVVEGRGGGGLGLGLGVHWVFPRLRYGDGTSTIVHVFDKSQLVFTLVNANLARKMTKQA